MDMSVIFRDPRFWVFDFDGTIGQTFQPSPNNIGVAEAYDLALQKIFGQDTFGDSPLELIGGLKNRAPSEVIAALFKEGQPDKLIQIAKSYFNQQGQNLEGFVPPDKGVPLVWPEKTADFDSQRVIAEMLVRIKLSILMKEIGPAWPQPCQGFLEFYQSVIAPGSKIVMAILSSGHDKFIEKVFETWGLACPALMVTDDDVRGLNFTGEPGKTAKPSPWLLDLVYLRWLAQQGDCFETTPLTQFLNWARQRTIYFGDDQVKDGQLAQNADVRFGWFNPEGKRDDKLTNFFSFQDWQEVPKILEVE